MSRCSCKCSAGPDFPQWVASHVHENAPDASTQLVEVGVLRKAAKQITALYEALEDSERGPRTWGIGRNIERALRFARGER